MNLFMHGWFYPFHLIRRKSLHFEKTFAIVQIIQLYWLTYFHGRISHTTLAVKCWSSNSASIGIERAILSFLQSFIRQKNMTDNIWKYTNSCEKMKKLTLHRSIPAKSVKHKALVRWEIVLVNGRETPDSNKFILFSFVIFYVYK